MPEGAAAAFSFATAVDRPVWRWFASRELGDAVAHVRRGGFAAVEDKKGALKILLPRSRDGKLTEMSLWALLAIDLRRWGAAGGAARGLAAVWIKNNPDREVIVEWCARDKARTVSVHALSLDCSQCGACCRDNHAVIEESDLRVWRKANRHDLLSRAYLRRSQGQVVLRLSPTGRCLHLGPGNHCRIYDLRPSNCSTFPVGSEACLAARQETLGIID